MKLRDLFPSAKLVVDLIPQTNVNRPGLPLHATTITIHENGNPNPGVDAYSERNYTHGGGGPDTASYHFAVSSNSNTGDVVMQLLPLNENGWHAGDGYYGHGNRTSIAIEHCQWGNFERTLALGQALCAALISEPSQFVGGDVVALPKDVERALVQHYYWTKKNCPQYIRARGLWETYKANVAKLLASHQPAVFPYTGHDKTIVPPWGGKLLFRAVHRKMKVAADAPVYSMTKVGFVPTNDALPRGTIIDVYAVIHHNSAWYYQIADNRFVREDALTHRIRVIRQR